MAIYHLRVKVHSRRPKANAPAGLAPSSTSIVRAAAYRSGGLLRDARTGEEHDFARKRGVEYTAIMAPQGAPGWVYDRAALWNAAEAAETRINARLAREWEGTLPREFTPEQCVAAVRRFAAQELVGRGVVVDIAIHRPLASDGADQPHFHMLGLTRAMRPDGLGEKLVALDKRDLLLQWRKAWADICNEMLAEAGSRARIDHRTLRAQGIDRQPQKPHGLARRVKVPSARLKERLAHNEDVAAYNSTLQEGRRAARAMQRSRGGKGRSPSAEVAAATAVTITTTTNRSLPKPDPVDIHGNHHER